MIDTYLFESHLLSLILLTPLVGVAVLASCGSLGGGRVKLEPEAFGSTTTHSRRFETAPAYTCEAARRAFIEHTQLLRLSNGVAVNLETLAEETLYPIIDKTPFNGV